MRVGRRKICAAFTLANCGADFSVSQIYSCWGQTSLKWTVKIFDFTFFLNQANFIGDNRLWNSARERFINLTKMINVSIWDADPEKGLNATHLGKRLIIRFSHSKGESSIRVHYALYHDLEMLRHLKCISFLEAWTHGNLTQILTRKTSSK